MSYPFLAVRGLEVAYGGQKVLRGVSLDVRKGSLVALIGPNGHGKTTLLRTISGFVQSQSGEIILDDVPISGGKVEQVVARGIIHIPQGDMLFPDMSVYDNLMMGAYLPAAFRAATERMESVFALLPRLEERKQQFASTLSGGERRMLAIGRGLMSDAKLLLIDEPSLGLAPLIIDQIYEVIEDLRKQGMSILLVEENANRAMSIADHIYLLDDGKIVWQGGAEEMAASEEILATYLGG